MSIQAADVLPEKKNTNYKTEQKFTSSEAWAKPASTFDDTQAPSTLIRFQTKTELFYSVFKTFCIHTYRFRIVFARPYYNAVSVWKRFHTLSAHTQMNSTHAHFNISAREIGVIPISFPELRSPWPAVGNESSGSIHFQITMEITEFCISGFTAHACAVRSAQSACMVSMAHAWNGCSQSSRFPTAGQGERSSGNEIGVILDSLLAPGRVYLDDVTVFR